jgi:hypothetical protein
MWLEQRLCNIVAVTAATGSLLLQQFNEEEPREERLDGLCASHWNKHTQPARERLLRHPTPCAWARGLASSNLWAGGFHTMEIIPAS